jgi:hypothetical protein
MHHAGAGGGLPGCTLPPACCFDHLYGGCYCKASQVGSASVYVLLAIPLQYLGWLPAVQLPAATVCQLRNSVASFSVWLCIQL